MLLLLNPYLRAMNDGMCKCPHHKIVPILVILLGLVFLLQALDVISTGLAEIAWPILIILIGGQKLMGGACSCCSMKK